MLGDLRQLPRAGLQRRTNINLLQEMDQAYGVSPPLFDWIKAPMTFNEKIDMPDRTDHAQALWQAVVNAPDNGLLRTAPIIEKPVTLTAPREGETITADYRSLGLTLGRHPLALLRSILTRKRFLPVETLNTFSHGQFARGCGIVTVRQRPGTAKGVIFLTMEDETGSINVIVWPALVEKQRKELLGSTLLGVYGIWQYQGIVRHLIAKRLVDLSPLLGELATATHSRDFM